MIERTPTVFSAICSVIDSDDVPAIASVFINEKKRERVKHEASLFSKDGRPFVVSLNFYDDGTTNFDFGYRYGDLTPGDEGKVTYFENYFSKDYDEDAEGNVIVEQVCFSTFLRILKLVNQNHIMIE